MKKPLMLIIFVLAFALETCFFETPAVSKEHAPKTYSFSGSSLMPAADIKPTSLVIIMHGYGGSEDDFVSLAEEWRKCFPSTLFFVPRAPFPCARHPEGYQWFWLEGWDFPRMLTEVEALTPSFHNYIDDLTKTYNIPPGKVVFVGFSQGAMMAIHMALTCQRCAGAIAYSGTFMGVGKAKNPSGEKPPILLIHGRDDKRVSPSFSQKAKKQLKALGVPVRLVLLPDLAHDVDQRGIALGREFLTKILK